MLDPTSELLRRRCGQVLAKEPGNADAHHVLAMLALMEEKYEEALVHLETAVANRPVFPEAHHTLADLRDRMGHPFEAFRHFQLAGRQDAARYGTYEHYGRAIGCLQAALRLQEGANPVLPPVEYHGPLPFFSVVICSIDPAKQAFIERHYASLLSQVPHELIVINDARSLAEGYNRGIARSRGDAVILSHDDIEIVNEDFAPRLCAHLEKFDVVGVAGTDYLDRPAWHAMGWPHVHGMCGFRDANGMGATVYDLTGPYPPIMALDGLFLAFKRPLFDKHRFDEETFTGFHLYDLDFTLGAYRKGFSLGVCHDIGIIHASAGNYASAEWQRYAGLFAQKYAGKLAAPAVGKADLRWFQGVQVAGVDGFRRLLGLLNQPS